MLEWDKWQNIEYDKDCDKTVFAWIKFQIEFVKTVPFTDDWFNSI